MYNGKGILIWFNNEEYIITVQPSGDCPGISPKQGMLGSGFLLEFGNQSIGQSWVEDGSPRF
jgi:hypothetical protein